jgi:hypothetical protein
MVPDAPVSSTGLSGIIKSILSLGSVHQLGKAAAFLCKALATPIKILYHHVIV